jgi:HemY protein
VRVLFWLVLLFALAVGASLLTEYDRGYVLLVAPPYRIELSLILFVLVYLALLATGYVLLRFFSVTMDLPDRVHGWRESRRRQSALDSLLNAWTAFYEGRYAQAERSAQTAAREGAPPLACHLLAAESAHLGRAYERRDRHLAEAEVAAPEPRLARLMTRARLLLDERRPQEALDTVAQLGKDAPDHVVMQRLSLRANLQLERWDEVIRLATALSKRNALEPALAREHLVQAHLGNLRARATDDAQLARYWDRLVDEQRRDVRLASAVAAAFQALGNDDKAADILESALENEWEPALLRRYGQLAPGNLVKRIDRAERWLRQRPQDPELLLALGRLCIRQELWGKAKSYLEASLALRESPDACFGLARLQEKLGQTDSSCATYRRGLALLEKQSG